MKKYLALTLFILSIVAFTPKTTFAAWRYVGGAELNSVTDGVEVTTNQTPIATSSTAHTGNYSWEVKNGTGFLRNSIFTTNQTSTSTLRAWIYVKVYPNASTRLMYQANVSNTFQDNITMASDGTLLLLKASGAQIGSASAAVPLNTWTCVAIQDAPTTGATGNLVAQVNGTTFASGANSAAGSWGRVLLGNVTGAQTSNDVLIDDVVVTDGTTGFPGCGNDVFFHPTAAGDANSWLQTAGGAGSGTNYTLTNEAPPDDSTSFVSSAILNSEDLYKFNSSGTHSYDTINFVGVGTRYANDTANATDAYRIEWEASSGGTKVQSADLVPNSTTWTSYGVNATPQFQFQFSTTTEATGGALTNTDLDNMQAGYIEDVLGLNKIQITNIWAYADYTAGVAPSSGNATSSLLWGEF